jgi:hypothetical protein
MLIIAGVPAASKDAGIVQAGMLIRTERQRNLWIAYMTNRSGLPSSAYANISSAEMPTRRLARPAGPFLSKTPVLS